MSAGTDRSRYQALRAHLAYLRLTAAAEALPAELERATREKLGPTAFLEGLLGIEVQATEERRQSSRLRFASFPAPWRLEDFDFDAQPSIDRKLVDELATLRFVADAGNVLLIGPPGVGKTMLSICLGRQAVEAGHRVYYTTAADLVARCHRAAIEGRWATTMRFFQGPAVLIIDELGYLPLQSEAAAALVRSVAVTEVQDRLGGDVADAGGSGDIGGAVRGVESEAAHQWIEDTRCGGGEQIDSRPIGSDADGGLLVCTALLAMMASQVATQAGPDRPRVVGRPGVIHAGVGHGQRPRDHRRPHPGLTDRLNECLVPANDDAGIAGPAARPGECRRATEHDQCARGPCCAQELAAGQPLRPAHSERSMESRFW